MSRKQLILCFSCNGHGRYTEESMRIGNCDHARCSTCNGDGRLIETVSWRKLTDTERKNGFKRHKGDV